MLKKTIIGNLGNQMFQYAALRGMQAKYYPNEEIELSFTAVNYRTGERITKPNWLEHFELRPYRVAEEIRPVGIQRLVSGALGFYIQKQWDTDDIATRRNIQHDIEVKFQPLLNRFGLYQMQDGYCDWAKCNVKDKHFTGYFESEQYFAHIGEEIRKEFTPIQPPRPENEELYRRMAETNSVCISIRRGDFVGTEIDGYANLCGPAYFKAAMEKMKELVKNPVFFVFSNDLPWVREHMDFPGEVYFERGDDPVWESLRLMSSCKHFIISNSSFHWWVQYLSKHPEKQVIAPDQWRRNSPRPDIYLPGWTLLPV